jgi:RNA polymerase sigma-70 factor (ECF subfamily)
VNEQELIARCISGQDDAWRDLLLAYDPVLRHLARLYLRSLNAPGDDTQVEEIRSGVLEMLVAHDARILRTFKWQCSFETWLRVIIRTVCVRSVRRKKIDPRELRSPEAPVAPLDRLLSEERSRAVRDALNALPERERTVLSMFFVDGKSYREISAVLRIPMGTIATLLARTRQRLRDLLESKGS